MTKPTTSSAKPTAADLPVSDAQLAELQAKIIAAQESERRALADYQNLVKRTQDTQARMIKFANRELVSGLLQPLEHLDLAAAQLKDTGLDMVVKQFWQVLEQAGLQEIKALNQPFDPLSMEAVESGEQRQQVVKVIKKGYTFQGEVIQPAKVSVD